jgi:hypothetical protein
MAFTRPYGDYAREPAFVHHGQVAHPALQHERDALLGRGHGAHAVEPVRHDVRHDCLPGGAPFEDDLPRVVTLRHDAPDPAVLPGDGQGPDLLLLHDLERPVYDRIAGHRPDFRPLPLKNLPYRRAHCVTPFIFLWAVARTRKRLLSAEAHMTACNASRAGTHRHPPLPAALLFSMRVYLAPVA